jgi:peptidoglycan/LPS O-acetylase OafA/YrhL
MRPAPQRVPGSDASAAPRPRFACLEGVRGLAALMVALSHFVLAVQPALLGSPGATVHFAAAVPLSQSAAILPFNPALGVAVFFVMSGFVLAASVAGRGAWLPELALRRWLRLCLPILATTLVIWAMLRLGLFHNVEAARLSTSVWLAPFFSWAAYAEPTLAGAVSQSLFDVLASGSHWYNPVLWTIRIEFWGSLALFAAYTLLPGLFRAPEGGVTFGLLATALLWGTPYAGIVHGLLLFEAMRAVPHLPARARRLLAWLRPRAAPALLALGLVLGGMPFRIDVDGPFYGRLYIALVEHTLRPIPLMHELAAALVVAGVLAWRPARRLLAAAPLRWLGRISYMLYAVHLPLLCSLIAWLLLRGAPRMDYNLLSLLLLAVFLATSLLAAELAARLFDAPAIRLARWAGAALARRLRPRPAPLPRPAPTPGASQPA